MSLNGGGIGFDATNRAPASGRWATSTAFQSKYVRTGGVQILATDTLTGFSKSGSTHTSTTDADIGSASSGRVVWVVYPSVVLSNTPVPLTSLTIGGVSATKAASSLAANVGSNYGESSVWYAAVPSGTTASISFTYSDTSGLALNFPGILVVSTSGASTTPVDYSTDIYSIAAAGDFPRSLDLNTEIGGLVFGMAIDFAYASTSIEDAGVTAMISRFYSNTEPRSVAGMTLDQTISALPLEYTPVTSRTSSGTTHIYAISVGPE